MNGYKTLNGSKYFSSGLFQNYLVFISAKKCIKYFNGTTEIYSWQSNGMSEKSIENITKSDIRFAPAWINYYPLLIKKFNEHV